jgi:MFS family permease
VWKLTVLQWSFLFFFAIFELGSVLCGAATSSAMLIVGRTVAGLGGAGIINGAIMIISGCVPQEKRPGEYYYIPKPRKLEQRSRY